MDEEVQLVDYSKYTLSEDLIFLKPQFDPPLVFYSNIVISHEGTILHGRIFEPLEPVVGISHCNKILHGGSVKFSYERMNVLGMWALVDRVGRLMVLCMC